MEYYIETWNLLKTHVIDINQEPLLELHQLSTRKRSSIESFLRSCSELKSTESACYIVKRELRTLGLDDKTSERFITFIDEFQLQSIKLKKSAFELIQEYLTVRS